MTKSERASLPKDSAVGINQSWAGRCPAARCSESSWRGKERSSWEQARPPPSGWSAASPSRWSHHLVSGGEERYRVMECYRGTPHHTTPAASHCGRLGYKAMASCCHDNRVLVRKITETIWGINLKYFGKNLEMSQE